jgi:hypothetical protein
MNANKREWAAACVRIWMLLCRRRVCLTGTVLLLWLAGTALSSRLFAYQSEARIQVLFQGVGDTQSAPHGKGNVYAPEILFENGIYRMWFGGQGKDGHDRIHLAESPDGQAWTQKGVVLDRGEDNHVNDPSVVHIGSAYWLYYTRARIDISDVIDVATSDDGVHWTKRGTALMPGKKGQWDALLVGRPSVIYDEGVFKMWYDGRKDLPLNAPDKNAPKSATSQRYVGYAESRDGLHWRRVQTKPVYADDAGGIHVQRVGQHYVMVYESGAGLKLADSPDGIHWQSRGLWMPKSGTDADRYGCLTPFLFLFSGGQTGYVYFGAASAPTWDANSMARAPLTKTQIDQTLQLSPTPDAK